VQRPKVLLDLLLLELGDSHLPMVNGQKVYQFLIVLNILPSHLNRSLQIEDVVLLPTLALKYGLQRLLPLRQLVQLTLIIPPLTHALTLHLCHQLTTPQSICHTLDVQ